MHSSLLILHFVIQKHVFSYYSLLPELNLRSILHISIYILRKSEWIILYYFYYLFSG